MGFRILGFPVHTSFVMHLITKHRAFLVNIQGTFNELEQGTLYRILHASDGILVVLVVFSEHSTFTVEC